ncbi:unnamed protein product [Schistosoma curassoni]|uniref:Ion_trans domain-containing protein n=1 Tax=Schistosoma curassoni TaxID=6186 RepID=A0A183JUS7_9TREM|nr:unnamed protein product [Schistosoma curassoni]
MQSDDFLNACPIHFQRLFLISSSAGSWIVLTHISYDEPQFTISDSNLRSGSFTAEEKLVAQLLNRGSLTVRPNGYMNQSTNPVHVNITYNVVQILGFVGLFFVYFMVNNAVENFVHKFLDRRKDTLIENALRVFTIPSRFDYKDC